MTWENFFVGVCLFLIFEGIMPFISPDKYKEYIKKIAETEDGKLRIYGLVSMVLGIVVLFLINANG